MNLKVSAQTNHSVELLQRDIKERTDMYIDEVMNEVMPDYKDAAVYNNVRKVFLDFTELSVYKKQLDHLFKDIVGAPVYDSKYQIEPIKMIKSLIDHGSNLQGINSYVFQDNDYINFKIRLDQIKKYYIVQVGNYIEYKKTGNKDLIKELTLDKFEDLNELFDYANNNGLTALDNYCEFAKKELRNNPLQKKKISIKRVKQGPEVSTPQVEQKKYKMNLQAMFRRMVSNLTAKYDKQQQDRDTGYYPEEPSEYQKIINDHPIEDKSVEEISNELERDHQRLKAFNEGVTKVLISKSRKPKDPKVVKAIMQQKALRSRYAGLSTPYTDRDIVLADPESKGFDFKKLEEYYVRYYLNIPFTMASYQQRKAPKSTTKGGIDLEKLGVDGEEYVNNNPFDADGKPNRENSDFFTAPSEDSAGDSAYEGRHVHREPTDSGTTKRLKSTGSQERTVEDNTAPTIRTSSARIPKTRDEDDGPDI